MKCTLKCAAACIAILVALAPQRVTGQDVADAQAVLRRVELLEATQLRMLRELESISTQLAKGGRRASGRVSPPPPAIPRRSKASLMLPRKGHLTRRSAIGKTSVSPLGGNVELPETRSMPGTGKFQVVRHAAAGNIHRRHKAEAADAQTTGKVLQVHDPLADQRLTKPLVSRVANFECSAQQFSEAFGEGGSQGQAGSRGGHALGRS